MHERCFLLLFLCSNNLKRSVLFFSITLPCLDNKLHAIRPLQSVIFLVDIDLCDRLRDISQLTLYFPGAQYVHMRLRCN